MNWNETWISIKEAVTGFFTTGGLVIIKFVAALVLGILLIKIINMVTKKLLSKTKMEKVIQTFIMSILKFFLDFLLVILLVQILSIPITGFIAILSAAGLALALALQGSLSNVANGMILVSTKPFKQGDYISVAGQEGTVKAIRILTTVLYTLDNKVVIIPNSDINSNSIINYSHNAKRKVEFNFSVAYDSDVDNVKSIILKVMKSNGKIYIDDETKPTFVGLKALGASSLDFYACCWCDNEDCGSVKYYVNENVFNEFKRENISVPFNQMEVRLLDNEVKNPVIKKSLEKRIEKERVASEEETLVSLIVPKKLSDVICKTTKKLKKKISKKTNKAKNKPASSKVLNLKTKSVEEKNDKK